MVFSLVDEEYLDANGNILWNKFTLFKQNKRAWKPFIDFQAPKVQGMRESNSHQRFWRPLSYHLTNPLYLILRYVPSKPHTLYHISLNQQGQAFDLLVSVSYIHYCTSTSDLSTSSSSRGLTRLLYGISHLEGGFTLRCLQRLSRPGLATRLCIW